MGYKSDYLIVYIPKLDHRKIALINKGYKNIHKNYEAILNGLKKRTKKKYI